MWGFASSQITFHFEATNIHKASQSLLWQAAFSYDSCTDLQNGLNIQSFFCTLYASKIPMLLHVAAMEIEIN